MARQRTRKVFRGLPSRVFERAADVMKVLGHPARLKLLELLCEHEFAVGELSIRLGMPQPTVSSHLLHMAAHGILTRHRVGRAVHYRVASADAAALLDAIHRQALLDTSFEGGEAI